MDAGAIVGSYRIEGLLGAGGMGAVYRATHQTLGKAAAVKVLLPRFSTDPGTVRRFFNEAKAATAIQSPSIVEIFDFGTLPDGSAYIVMELLRGESLASRIKRRLSVDQSLSIAASIARALEAAHGANIVHRDLKPDNVFIVPDQEVETGERIKLLDFGIAKLTAEANADHKTKTGSLMGTPAYMAPEQCRGVAVDHRADIYALGCILYEMLSGHPPFTGEGLGDILGAHMYTAPQCLALEDPRGPQISAFVDSLLAKAPSGRPPDARTVGEHLELLRASAGTSAAPAAQKLEAQESAVPSSTEAKPAVTAMLGRLGTPAKRSREGTIALAVTAMLVIALPITCVIRNKLADDPPSRSYDHPSALSKLARPTGPTEPKEELPPTEVIREVREKLDPLLDEYELAWNNASTQDQLKAMKLSTRKCPYATPGPFQWFAPDKPIRNSALTKLRELHQKAQNRISWAELSDLKRGLELPPFAFIVGKRKDPQLHSKSAKEVTEQEKSGRRSTNFESGEIEGTAYVFAHTWGKIVCGKRFKVSNSVRLGYTDRRSLSDRLFDRDDGDGARALQKDLDANFEKEMTELFEVDSWSKSSADSRPQAGSAMRAGSATILDEKRKAVVSIGPVSGDLDKNSQIEISTVFNKQVGAFQGCYQKGLDTQPSIAGTITYSFDGTGNISVSPAKLGKHELSDEVAKCVSLIVAIGFDEFLSKFKESTFSVTIKFTSVKDS